MHPLSEQEVNRREKILKNWTQMGIDAYPSDTFEVNTTAQQIKDQFKPGDDTFQEVSLAGRMMSQRIMGKASFAELMDSTLEYNFT